MSEMSPFFSNTSSTLRCHSSIQLSDSISLKYSLSDAANCSKDSPITKTQPHNSNKVGLQSKLASAEVWQPAIVAMRRLPDFHCLPIHNNIQDWGPPVQSTCGVLACNIRDGIQYACDSHASTGVRLDVTERVTCAALSHVPQS